MGSTIKIKALDQEDYIDMEIASSSSSSTCSSSSSLFCCSISSPTQTKEFEFQMFSIPDQEKETTTSPADELFYKGKLLPLHLPPRLQMVQKILQNSDKKPEEEEEAIEETFTIPFITTKSSTAPSTNTSTPLGSCNISPSESCRASCELNTDEYLSQWATEVSVFIDSGGRSKKPTWSTKLKQKQFSLARKLKASREYLKSLFNKPACSDGSCAEPENAASASKGKDCLDKCMSSVSRKIPFGRIDNGKYQKISTTLLQSIENEMAEAAALSNSHCHRKSFSGVIQRHCLATKSSSTSNSSSGSSSSSSSFSSNGFHELQLLKRSSSANSELEGSIEGAIAHCKQSQQLYI
ncbi:hypothetical protein UlMin_005960 [Ulmus minor]